MRNNKGTHIGVCPTRLLYSLKFPHLRFICFKNDQGPSCLLSSKLLTAFSRPGGALRNYLALHSQMIFRVFSLSNLLSLMNKELFIVENLKIDQNMKEKNPPPYISTIRIIKVGIWVCLAPLIFLFTQLASSWKCWFYVMLIEVHVDINTTLGCSKCGDP